MVTSYIDGFPAAPKKDATKPKNADRQESAGKKKASVNRLSSAKSNESRCGASRDLNDILNDRAIKPTKDRQMDLSDQEETIEIG